MMAVGSKTKDSNSEPLLLRSANGSEPPSNPSMIITHGKTAALVLASASARGMNSGRRADALLRMDFTNRVTDA